MAVKGPGNVTVMYNSVNITAYCDQADLDNTLEQLEASNLASTANESVAGFPTWSISVGGPWAPALDNALGPDAVTPGNKRNASIAFVHGANTVTYSWTANAEIANYKVSGAVKAVHKWSGKLQLSNAPTRTSV
jgi:hypothetical protein